MRMGLTLPRPSGLSGRPTTHTSPFVFHPLPEGDQPCRFPHPASAAFCVSSFCSSFTGRLHLSGQRRLDWIQRSVLLSHDHIELSSSKKNAYHFDKVLNSEV